MTRLSRRLGWVSFIALCPVAAHAQVASAQASADGQGTDEIIVTANKREQSLSKVGLQVTALTGAQLSEHRIVSLQDITSAVPGLTFAQSQGNTPILTFRGVGYNNNSLAAYPAVSVYVDQAPLPFAVLASHSAFDLERIEALKGPQGTLFGQNSTGGAINYIAAKPTDRFGAGGDITYGRFNDIQGTAYINVPVTPNFLARLSVSGETSEGWQVSQTRPYDRNGAVRYIAGRLLTSWTPTDRLKIELNINGWRDRSQPQAGQYIALRPQTTVKPIELANPFTLESPRIADWSVGALTPRTNRSLFQATARLVYDATDDINLTLLSSYVRFRQQQTVDLDGSAINETDMLRNPGRITTFTQEARIANNTKSQFRWMLGVNYDRTVTFEDQLIYYPDTGAANPSNNNIFQSESVTTQKINQYAGFGSVEYDMAPEVTLRASGRYTQVNNEGGLCGYDAGDGRYAGFLNILGGFLGSVPFTPVGSTGPYDGRCAQLNQFLVPSGGTTVLHLNEHNFSWRVGVDYRPSSNTLLYANVSRGYKAGSFPVLAATTSAQFLPVTQESNTSYEVGAKISGLGNRVALDASAFYYDYRNKQILGKVLDQVVGTLDALSNVPQSRIYGADVNLTLRPVNGLTMSGSITYAKSKIQRYTGYNVLGQITDFSGKRLPFAPEISYSADISYRTELAGGRPFVGVTVAGQSSSDTIPGGGDIVIPVSPQNKVLPGLIHPYRTNAYATLGARLGYESLDGRWRVLVWGKNILNKYYWTNVTTVSGFSSRYAGQPATYGVTFGFTI